MSLIKFLELVKNSFIWNFYFWLDLIKGETKSPVVGHTLFWSTIEGVGSRMTWTLEEEWEHNELAEYTLASLIWKN